MFLRPKKFRVDVTLEVIKGYIVCTTVLFTFSYYQDVKEQVGNFEIEVLFEISLCQHAHEYRLLFRT